MFTRLTWLSSVFVFCWCHNKFHKYNILAWICYLTVLQVMSPTWVSVGWTLYVSWAMFLFGGSRRDLACFLFQLFEARNKLQSWLLSSIFKISNLSYLYYSSVVTFPFDGLLILSSAYKEFVDYTGPIWIILETLPILSWLTNLIISATLLAFAK